MTRRFLTQYITPATTTPMTTAINTIVPVRPSEPTRTSLN